YENTYKGIEQGFTIKEKPAGNGKLIVEGAVTTKNLSVENDAKGNITGTLLSNGYVAFKYEHLSAKDAKGKDLPVKLDLIKNTDTTYELDISVDDSEAEYPIIIDPISTTPSWTGKAGSTTDFVTIPTGVASAQYGKVATIAGDVNGDGRSDFLVTARSFTNGQVNEGAAYLYYGTGTGAMPATPGWAYESNSANAEFGHSASAAGDVNNDGYDDIVITADGYDTFRGKIYLFLGSPAGLSKTPAWTYTNSAGAANQNLGQSIAGAGDINGDGFDDIIVGAHYYSETGLVHEGAAFVFYGNASGFSSSPDWTIKGGMAGALLGFSVAGVGDLDKDGYADVLVGAPMYGASNEGIAYLYYGGAAGLPAAPSQTFTNGSAGSYFGNPVSPLGDVNKDGNLDILIGASRYDVGATDRGRVYAYYGAGNRNPLVVSWDKMDAAVAGSFFGCGSYSA
ncbi:MAG TPA: VCBS repeat-containing protein, partial [Methylococcales bacterium]